MKKTDIAMIILIATVGVAIAFFGVKALLGEQATDEQSVPSVERVESDITPPDARIFNSEAINPSVEVEIEGRGPSPTTTDAQGRGE